MELKSILCNVACDFPVTLEEIKSKSGKGYVHKRCKNELLLESNTKNNVGEHNAGPKHFSAFDGLSL